MAQPKIIVLDDDPTGSQTVHSCLLLLQWDVDTLRQGLRDASPIFFVLTNTRALTAAAAEQVTREVCQHLKQAIALEGIQDFLVVSRSDSTLRGHYPVETDAIAQELGPFDAHFLVPAFLKGDASPATAFTTSWWMAFLHPSTKPSLLKIRCLATAPAICLTTLPKKPQAVSQLHL